MFPKLQQKYASTFLTTMWKSEPFKAKWAIVAGAYSNIRDVVGKQRASLVMFLKLVCPRIGIIGIEDYFRKMNWSLETAPDGTTILVQHSVPDLSNFEARILYTDLTPRDIIHFCARMAYIPRSTAIQIAGPNSSKVAGNIQVRQMAQQSLLASSPIYSKPTQLSDVSKKHTTSSEESPQSVEDLHTPAVSPNERCEVYEWTGSMCDLYNPAVGSIDRESTLRNSDTTLWCAASAKDPQSVAPIQNTDSQDLFLGWSPQLRKNTFADILSYRRRATWVYFGIIHGPVTVPGRRSLIELIKAKLYEFGYVN